MKILHGRLKAEYGQAMIEFALVFPVLLMLILGCMEFSWYFANKYSLDQYSREIGYNISDPFFLVWNHDTAPREWKDSNSGEKPSWLTAKEKSEWSFDEYDGWYAWGKPTEGEMINGRYYYGALESEQKFKARLNNLDLFIDPTEVTYQIDGGWYIKAEGIHMPQSGGSDWKEERKRERTEYYYADAIVHISYEYRPLTFLGRWLFCRPGEDSTTWKEDNRYTYSLTPGVYS